MVLLEEAKATNTKPFDDSFLEISPKEVPDVSDGNDERNHTSSDDSDNDEDAKAMSVQQKVSQRRRIQNAKFEVLSVSILNVVLVKTDRYTGSPAVLTRTLSTAPQLGSLTCRMLSSPQFIYLLNKT